MQGTETSDILIAVSGGQDSVALAHLLAHQAGQKGELLRKRLVLAHINHGWRGSESDADELWVRDLADAWSVRFLSEKLKKTAYKGESAEAVGHRERRRIFQEWLDARPGSMLFTAHHRDDLAETVFWRISRGELGSMPQGILFQDGAIFRPLLEVPKKNIIQYLDEVGQPHREDSTNQNRDFTRNRIRLEILPALEKAFPRFSEHLSQHALQAQDRAHLFQRPGEVSGEDFPWKLIEQKEGLQVRRGQRQSVRKIRSEPKDGKGHRRLQLSGGWHLKQDQVDPGELERWVLIRS